jgi:hypothetical protein
MKKFIISCLLILFLVFSCGPTYVLTNNFDNRLRTIEQVDSIKRIERLPISWEKYKTVVMRTETSFFEQYIYIRRTDSTEVVYTITDLDSLYRFKKKTVQKYSK